MTRPDRAEPFGRLPAADPSGSVTALFEAEYDPMTRLAYILTRDQHLAEEIVQDAFLDVTERWATLLNPGGYLRTAVVNGARRHGRRSSNRLRILRDHAAAIAGPSEGSGHDDYIADALERLTENQRIAIVLAYYLELGSGEIAEALGCRPGTAKSHVHRGLAKLRKELEP